MTKRLFQSKSAGFPALSAKPMAVSLIVCVLLACTMAVAQTSAPSNQGGTIRGTVKSGNMPIPGVAVTAVNPQNRQRVITWTDVDGSYSLQVTEDGSYFVRTQMAAFAPAFTQVTINAANRTAKADLEMVLVSRAPDTRQQLMQQMAPQGGRGFQSLSVTPGEGGTDLSSAATDDPA